MTDRTEREARRVPRGPTDEMVRTAVREASDRLARRVQAEIRANGVPTGHAVPMAHLERLDLPASPVLLVRPDRRAYLDRAVRQANGARRVTRALRAILARLVKRANL